MKRELQVCQVDSLTGEIVQHYSKTYNYDIYEHKKQFLRMCESFYNKHFTNPLLSCELYIYFPEQRSELDLPF